MKGIPILLAGVLILTATFSVRSQSLAEMAKREKERRDAIKAPPRVITNLEAQRYRSGAVTTVTLPPPAEGRADQKPARAAEEEPTDLQGRPESFWRQTMSDARKLIRDLENESNVIVLKLADLQNRFYREDNGFTQQQIQREIQKALYEQDRNKDELARAKDQLASLEKEARKSGALPGWLTSKTP